MNIHKRLRKKTLRKRRMKNNLKFKITNIDSYYNSLNLHFIKSNKNNSFIFNDKKSLYVIYTEITIKTPSSSIFHTLNKKLIFLREPEITYKTKNKKSFLYKKATYKNILYFSFYNKRVRGELL